MITDTLPIPDATIQPAQGGASMKRGRKLWNPPAGVEINWTRPASHIAKDYGATTPTVTRYMRRHGLAVRKKGAPIGTRKLRLERNYNWLHQDVYLATEHGMTRERIRQLRKAARQPASGSPEWLAAGGIVTNPPHQGRRKAKP